MVTAISTAFDNSNTPKGLHRDQNLLNVVDDSKWTVFCLWRPRGDTSSQDMLRSLLGRFRIEKNSNGTCHIITKDAGANVLFNVDDTSGINMHAQSNFFQALVVSYDGEGPNPPPVIARFIVEGDTSWQNMVFPVPVVGNVSFLDGGLGLWAHTNGTVRVSDADVIYTMFHQGVALAWSPEDLAKIYNVAQGRFREITDNGAALLGSQANVLIKHQDHKTGVNTGNSGDFILHAHDGNGQTINFADEGAVAVGSMFRSFVFGGED